METQSQYAIRNMSTEELVQFVNDNIDTSLFPLGEIKSVGDIDHWEEIGDELGGYGLMTMLTKYPMPKKAIYFQYDSETYQVYWYATKKSIIDTVGIKTLCDWYECTLD